MERTDYFECPECFQVCLDPNIPSCSCKNVKNKVIELSGVASHGSGPYRIDDTLAMALHEVRGSKIVLVIRS